MVYFGILNEKFFSRRTTQQILRKQYIWQQMRQDFGILRYRQTRGLNQANTRSSVKDVFGKNLRIYYAEHDGVVFYHASGFVVKKGFSNLVAYGLIK